MSQPGRYRLVWAKALVKTDYEELDPSVQHRVNSPFRKLQQKPELGISCGHRMGCDLTGYRALHFGKNKYRIIYEVVEAEKKVRIWGIGKREHGRIYRMTGKRLSELDV